MTQSIVQFDFACPACGSTATASSTIAHVTGTGGYMVPCTVDTCKDCGMKYIVPSIFTGMRCIPPAAIDLLTLWDTSCEAFATLWTFYHNKNIIGYEKTYEELQT